ncbi:MAG: Rrf2 family transcriptional regulator [Erysipelotrichaceae bacterium]|nr:Rrf2 family transcriptional regulator [Erysipelotrichaceae bacterium]
MKLSTKGRYGLAVVILLNRHKGQTTSLLSISTSLDLSKIYLEQILAVLKSHQIVSSIKGPTGGYFIKTESHFTVYDVLSVLEPNLTSDDISSPQKTLGALLEDKVYYPLSQSVKSALASISIDELSGSLNDEAMYYI